MDKLYILLRNNKQLGPYSQQQLIQFAVEPGDLVWIQGKSTSWQKADTLEELTPFLNPHKVNFTTPATEAHKDQSSIEGSKEAPSVPRKLKYTYAQYPVMFDSYNLSEIGIEKSSMVPRRLINDNQTYSSSLVQSDKQFVTDVTGYRSPEEIKHEYDLWVKQNNLQQKSASNKRFGAMMFAVMISSLTFLWKGIKAKSVFASSVANHQLK